MSLPSPPTATTLSAGRKAIAARGDGELEAVE
jgi:hypothetical protein